VGALGHARVIRALQGRAPRVHAQAFVDDSALVIGDVEIGARSSVWMNAVIRGDVGKIRIGEMTNVQDLSVIHVRGGKFDTTLGNGVTIGHQVVLHGCTVRDFALVGIGAVVLDGAEVGEEAMVGAGALVTPGTVVPPRTLVVGAPARPKRALSDEEVADLRRQAQNYWGYAEDHLRGGAR
jgi:carbonic anhydrase/acetyltransferase-like protein (isoleucine patch superfamily)